MADRHWGALRAFLAFHRFDDAKLEAQFQQKYQQSTVQGCRLWAAIQLVLFVLNVAGGLTFFTPVIDKAGFWALFGIYLLCAVVAFVLSHSASISDSHLKRVLVCCHCLTLSAQGAQGSVFLGFQTAHNWGQPTEELSITMALVHELAAYFFVYMFAIDQHIQLLPLLNMGFCLESVCAILSGPIATLLFIGLGLPHSAQAFSLCPITFVGAIVCIVYCCNVSLLRRSIFLLELQRSLQTDETQRADSMITHIVKNVMVEAAGQIDAFLEVCAPPPPELPRLHLQCALERLQSGMAWCKRRRVLLALMNKEAHPNTAPTSLTALGNALAAHRSMTTSFTDLVVLLDEALTDLMLENAISNAFRHGHPTDPDVRFFITSGLIDQVKGTCTVTFRITNRSHPNRQLVTAELVQRCRLGHRTNRPSVPFSDGIGLQHCFQAAQLQGMAVSLAQEGDLIVFQASITTTVHTGTQTPVASLNPYLVSDPLPCGLRIVAIDDSASARMLLKHQLSRDCPGCVVDTFGSSAEDVGPFLSHTLSMADIAILDQHLDWPSGSLYLGTELVRLLLQAGFRGLLCIRSANMSEQDAQQYLAAGAHCVLDKLLDRPQMVTTLTTQYWRSVTARTCDQPTSLAGSPQRASTEPAALSFMSPEALSANPSYACSSDPFPSFP
eukprot:GGOE01025988.1.p1 GENE.GGOE01025988.1~~GGOE01025988.1.p1  ORF type:complete len:679 (-),score=215.88 GGOE01025988.1:17-2020(-)